MAINRLWQCGNELNQLPSEFDGTINTNTFGSCAPASGNSKTGTYALVVSGSSAVQNTWYSAKKNISPTYQIRCGFHWKVISVATKANDYRIWSIRDAANNVLAYIAITSDIASIYAYNGTNLGSVSISNNQYYHVGVDIKIDASVGWMYFYIDGTLIASKNGNTGSAQITHVLFGCEPHIGAVGIYQNPLYYDDMYIDDTTGESSPVPVPDIRFPFQVLDGDGTYSQFTTYTGSVHYALLDEIPPSSTDFVRSSTPGQIDSFVFQDYVLNGSTIDAIIPTAVAIKENATDIRLGFGVGFSGTFSFGYYSALPTSYGLSVFGRFTNNPLGGTWIANDINNIQIAIMSSGTYA